MERLIEHINILLAKHDFLVIAGIGGFVAQCKSASVCNEGEIHTWMPPQREISFNPVIKHDDGLLLESYIRREKMSAYKAESTIHKEIETLKTILWQQGEVCLGKLGKLTQQEGGHIEFIPSTESSLAYRYFGLAPVALSILPPIQTSLEIVKNQPDTQDDYIRIAIPRKKFYRTVGSAAALLIAGLLCIPVTLNRHSTFSAGLLPLTVQELISETPDSGSQVVETAHPSEQVSNVPSAEKSENRKSYYIIVSSCANTSEAKTVVDRLMNDGNTAAGVIEKDERVRVYIDKYDNREAAESALNTVRKEKKEFENAWLFITR